MSKIAISKLIDTRRRLDGELIAAQKVMLKLKADIAAIDHSMIILGYQGKPDDLKPIRPPRREIFARKELPKLIATVHRERPDLGSNTLIAMEIIKRKEWDNQDQDLLDEVTKKIVTCKYKNFRDGLRKRRVANSL